MAQRRLQVTPRARRDLEKIIAWYRQEFGPHAAAKAARSIQAGIRAAAKVELDRAKRADLPNGYFRIVAKAHLVIFRVENQTSQIIRILHGARDIASALEE